MTTNEARKPADRVQLWNGTVHYADANGKPACGSGSRTHDSWKNPTVATVTCSKCIKAQGEDTPGQVDPPSDYEVRMAQRAADRAARQAARTDKPNAWRIFDSYGDHVGTVYEDDMLAAWLDKPGHTAEPARIKDPRW